VVYLRSFGDDHATREHIEQQVSGLEFGGGTYAYPFSIEEELASAFREVGPFVAIGDPRVRPVANSPAPSPVAPGVAEPEQFLGANREYVDTNDWQKRVIDLVSRAQLIVVRIGRTTGLRWEIEEVVARADPSRLLLLVTTKKEYERFRSTFEARFLHGLPNYLPWYRAASLGGITGIVRFATNWKAEMISFRQFPFYDDRDMPLAQALKVALIPVFDELKMAYVAPKPNRFRTGCFILILAAVCGSILAVIASMFP
jgi:hypothetical protein